MVSGAVFADHLIAQRLTDCILLVPVLTRGQHPLDSSVRRVAQLCRALQRGFGELDQFYRNVLTMLYTTSPSVHSLSSVPTYSRFLGPHLTELTINNEHVTLIYEKHLQANNPARAAFRATLCFGDGTTRPVVVKFTPTYCADMHRLLAALSTPRAPTLHYCDRDDSVRGLFVVIIDYVAPATDAQWTAAHSTALREAVAALHAQDYVHGDIRRPNIILVDANLILIDFDWGGYEGRAKYPSCIFLDEPSIQWHRDVTRGGAIKKDHDLHFVEKLVARTR